MRYKLSQLLVMVAILVAGTFVATHSAKAADNYYGNNSYGTGIRNPDRDHDRDDYYHRNPYWWNNWWNWYNRPYWNWYNYHNWYYNYPYYNGRYY